MHEAFENIFAKQIDWYRAGQVETAGLTNAERARSLRALDFAETAIHRSMEEFQSSYELRSDAQLFLLLNLHQVVTMPLADANSPTPLDTQLMEELISDVKMILGASTQFAKDRKDLAASHIVWGLGQVLNDLHLKSWRLWDGRE